jgi:hypothetical protein
MPRGSNWASLCSRTSEERHTRVVVLNADTGSGKTGMVFGAALCLRQRYLERRDYEWFADSSRWGGRCLHVLLSPAYCCSFHHCCQRSESRPKSCPVMDRRA